MGSLVSLTHCNLCGSDEGTVLYQKRDTDNLLANKFKLIKCNGCGFSYVNPIPDEGEMEILYNFDAYYGVQKQKKSSFNVIEDFFYNNRVRKIEALKKHGRILDIGCGSGKFLSFLKKRDWEVYGVESSKSGTGISKNIFGIDVFNGTLKDANYPDSFFDVVSMWHVLEHIAEPNSILKEIKRIIKPGGLLFIAVPNIESFEAKLFGEKWFHLDIPRHLCHYSPETLHRLASKTGFSVSKISYFSLEHNLAGLLQSILNSLGCEFNYFYNKIKRGHQKSNTTYYSLIMSSFMATAGMPVIFLLTELASIFKLSECIEAHLIAKEK